MHAKNGSIGRCLAVVTVTLLTLPCCLCAPLDLELLHLPGFLKRKDKAAKDKGEAHQNGSGRPARPTRPGRTSKRTHARDPGVASFDLQGKVSASTRNSPGAPAESPVERRTVRETGRVSDRVHTRQPPQRKQPKTGARGTRQGQPHRGAPNGYDAERAQRPCLGGGQRQAQSARFSASLRVPHAAIK